MVPSGMNLDFMTGVYYNQPQKYVVSTTKGDKMDLNFLQSTLLFQGSSTEEIGAMLKCLGTKEQSFSRGTVILHAGDTVRSIGLVLAGRVQIENDDLWGNKSVLDSVGPGQVFAETYACIPGEPMMVSAVAAENCDILFLNASRVLTSCPSACSHHSRLVQNLLLLSARKNLNLSRRIFHTSPKSIRGRLLSYLSFQAAVHQSREFTIPFNRQQLADYLSVDRSAMSAELGRMRDEGILETERNYFQLKQSL